MGSDDYDNPEVLERWCGGQRERVEDYLRSQGVKHGRIGDWPAWHVAPCVSIWAIESLARPEWIGWWVICGDLPTDYISSADVEPPEHPRKAVRVIADRWLKLVDAWKAGRDYEGVRVGEPESHQELGPLLESRARLLLEWAGDESMWTE